MLRKRTMIGALLLTAVAAAAVALSFGAGAARSNVPLSCSDTQYKVGVYDTQDYAAPGVYRQAALNDVGSYVFTGNVRSFLKATQYSDSTGHALIAGIRTMSNGGTPQLYFEQDGTFIWSTAWNTNKTVQVEVGSWNGGTQYVLKAWNAAGTLIHQSAVIDAGSTLPYTFEQSVSNQTAGSYCNELDYVTSFLNPDINFGSTLRYPYTLTWLDCCGTGDGFFGRGGISVKGPS